MPSDQRPPSAGRVSGWRPETGPSLEEATDLLATCDLTIEGRLPWSSNLTFLVSLEGTDPGNRKRRPMTPGDPGDPGDPATIPRSGDPHDPDRDRRRPVQAVYKPHRGEQSLWDFPDGLYRREVAAYRLSEALGWGRGATHRRARRRSVRTRIPSTVHRIRL